MTNTNPIDAALALLLWALEGVCWLINEALGHHSQAAAPAPVLALPAAPVRSALPAAVLPPAPSAYQRPAPDADGRCSWLGDRTNDQHVAYVAARKALQAAAAEIEAAKPEATRKPATRKPRTMAERYGNASSAELTRLHRQAEDYKLTDRQVRNRIAKRAAMEAADAAALADLDAGCPKGLQVTKPATWRKNERDLDRHEWAVTFLAWYDKQPAAKRPVRKARRARSRKVAA